jgi:hypothetical protein
MTAAATPSLGSAGSRAAACDARRGRAVGGWGARRMDGPAGGSVGRRRSALDEACRGLQGMQAALDEACRGLQGMQAALDEACRGLQGMQAALDEARRGLQGMQAALDEACRGLQGMQAALDGGRRRRRGWLRRRRRRRGRSALGLRRSVLDRPARSARSFASRRVCSTSNASGPSPSLESGLTCVRRGVVRRTGVGARGGGGIWGGFVGRRRRGDGRPVVFSRSFGAMARAVGVAVRDLHEHGFGGEARGARR